MSGSAPHDVPTMSEVRAVIDDRRRRLVHLPFFRALDESSDFDDLRRFVPQLYFFVFAFQDMLRLAHERMTDSDLREIAGQHRAEDAGHERWFTSDVTELGCERDVVWVFGKTHRETRDFCYAILSEILHAGDDRLKLVFPLVLEAGGSVFFERVIGLIERTGYQGNLRYFARSHEQVEKAHDMFTTGTQHDIDRVPLPGKVFDDATALVHRCFDACESFSAHLEHHRSHSR